MMRKGRAFGAVYAGISLVLALNASDVFAANAPEVELRPAPENLGALPAPNFDLNPYDPNLDWGVGLLEPIASPDYLQRLAVGGHEMLIAEFGEYIDWIARLDLPVFDAPPVDGAVSNVTGGRQWGWLTQGRIVNLDNGEEYPIPRTARLRVSYDLETEALFVTDAREDGWVEFRWGGMNAPHGGTAWTHPGFQNDPEIGVTYHSWEDTFRDTRSRIAYRNSEAAHLMRAAPSREAEIVHRIEGRDWDMEILEIQGDWIRVRVSWPSDCGSAPRDGEAEGWTVWRSETQGPWIYSPIGGC